MPSTDISLKALELFRLTANSGSLRSAAEESGLAISTVSHHLRRLEEAVGAKLLDHKRRPLALTPAGAVFLKNVDPALAQIRGAAAEAAAAKISDIRRLRLGFIEDFDSDIAPELAVHLSSGLSNCEFVHATRYSKEILNLLRKGQLDLGVAVSPVEDQPELEEAPLLRDPFVIVAPDNTPFRPDDFLSGAVDIPLLRYSQNQIIGAQIEAQLRRLGVELTDRIEIESNQTIMAMVAAGAGWTITTPLCYFRARRFAAQARLSPFPGKEFARQISLFATRECPSTVVRTVERALRGLIDVRLLRPAHDAIPWLRDSLRPLT